MYLGTKIVASVGTELSVYNVCGGGGGERRRRRRRSH